MRYYYIRMDGYKQFNYYRLKPDEVLAQLRSSASGLPSQEAAERLEQLGANVLNVAHKEPVLLAYARQFKDWMIVLLLASSMLSAYLGDMRTAIVLLVLVFFNTTIVFSQEHKAEKLIASLEKLVVAKASVLRDGKMIEVP